MFLIRARSSLRESIRMMLISTSIGLTFPGNTLRRQNIALNWIDNTSFMVCWSIMMLSVDRRKLLIITNTFVDVSFGILMAMLFVEKLNFMLWDNDNIINFWAADCNWPALSSRWLVCSTLQIAADTMPLHNVLNLNVTLLKVQVRSNIAIAWLGLPVAKWIAASRISPAVMLRL